MEHWVKKEPLGTQPPVTFNRPALLVGSCLVTLFI